jgi:hypothetical protein
MNRQHNTHTNWDLVISSKKQILSNAIALRDDEAIRLASDDFAATVERWLQSVGRY